jgi:hypothetical protein
LIEIGGEGVDREFARKNRWATKTGMFTLSVVKDVVIHFKKLTGEPSGVAGETE